MSTHELKIQREWFDRIVSGEKVAEIRKHDRDFQAGDQLFLEVYPTKYGTNGDPLSEAVTVTVTHVLDGRLAQGIEDGYCLLSISMGGAS